MKNTLSFIFGFEILAMAVAAVVFRVLESRFLAAMIAGSGFVALGMTIFILGLRDKKFRKTFTFWLGCIHLFAVALPMMLTRIFTTGEFQQVMVLGMPGPVFHKVSEMFYACLVVGTVIDRVKNRADERRQRSSQ